MRLPLMLATVAAIVGVAVAVPALADPPPGPPGPVPDDPVADQNFLASLNNAGMNACRVIGPSLASVAIDQGRQAVCGALGLDFPVHVDQIPAAAVYGSPEVARAGSSEEDCAAQGIPYDVGRCELGTTPRGLIAGQEGLLKLIFHGGTGVLLGVRVIREIAAEIAGTGQAVIHNEATIEDAIRMACNTPTNASGHKLAAADVLPGCTATYSGPWACRHGRTGSDQGPAKPGTWCLSIWRSQSSSPLRGDPARICGC